MSQPVLFASRDTLLLCTRTSLLRHAGFMTLRIQDLGVMVSMARFSGFRTIVLDHTISPNEQKTIIRKLQECSALFHIICVRSREVPSCPPRQLFGSARLATKMTGAVASICWKTGSSCSAARAFFLML